MTLKQRRLGLIHPEIEKDKTQETCLTPQMETSRLNKYDVFQNEIRFDRTTNQ